MIYSKHSSRSPEEIEQRLREAAQRQKFGVLHVQDLKQTLRSKGFEFAPECRIFDVCNPMAASTVLAKDLKVSTVLPCRISLYSDGDGYALSTVTPTEMMKATGLPGLEEVASDVERAMKTIIDEAV